MATPIGHRIGRDEIIWAFGPGLEPVLAVEPGETVTFDIFLSVACDAGVAQACKPAPGFGTIARFAIPKLDATPQPFRASLQSG